MKPFALPMAPIPVKTQEGSECLVVGVLQDISFDILLGNDCITLRQDPMPASLTAKDSNPVSQKTKNADVSEHVNIIPLFLKKVAIITAE